MKKIVLLLIVLFSFGLAGCQDNNVIRVSATHVPHAEILEEVRGLLEEKGFSLEIIVSNQYAVLNPSVSSKSADANYFQHIPYLNNYNDSVKSNKQLVIAANIHIEPIGLYSPVGYKSINDIKNGDTILVSNSESDQARLFCLLEKLGLITLKEGTGANATEEDIQTNPKNLVFKKDVNPELLVQAFNNNEAPIIQINSNYALEAGMSPQNDSFAIESPNDNPYVNVLVCRKGDLDSPKIKVLIEVLTSEHIKNFINSKYSGAVVPAF